MRHDDGLMRIALNPGLRDGLEPTLGNYSHQFRNRLNSIKLALYLVRRQSHGTLAASWQSLEVVYLAVEDRLDRIQRVCREADVTRLPIDLNLFFEDRSAAWTSAMNRGGADLVLLPPAGGCPTRVDIERLASGLDDLKTWRATARSGPREVRVSWELASDRTTILWREHLGDSSIREGEGAEPWQTWTLPSLARLMVDHGGKLSHSEETSWDLELSWPN